MRLQKQNTSIPKNCIQSTGCRFFFVHDMRNAIFFYDTITIVASPYQIMILSMAYERDIATQWPCFLLMAVFSCHRCAVLLVCVTSSVGCAAPKALASPTLISFRRYAALSRPYRAPILMLLSVGCALFECLPTATKSHALRAEMPLRGSSEAAGGTHRGTPEAAGGTMRNATAGRRAAHPRPQAGRTAAQPTPQAGRRAALPRPQAGRTAACL